MVVNYTRIYHRRGSQNMSETTTLPYFGGLREICGQGTKNGCRDG